VSRRRNPPSLVGLLVQAVADQKRPVAFVVAGHNGSGKTTLWYQRLVSLVQVPLINADRLTASILPTVDVDTQKLPQWALQVRDDDVRWQSLSQGAVRAFVTLVTDRKMSFAIETVFSHWKRLSNGQFESKTDLIRDLQAKGYYCVLIFVGLSSVDLSILRVGIRREQGGHDVSLQKLRARFPRTQLAVGHAADVADMTLMFDNSRSLNQAFAMVRVQKQGEVLFDCRDTRYKVERETRALARRWLDKVVGPFPDEL